jgi:hypothetical protein
MERIRPGHPQQNGRPERMHLTLKTEATRPPDANILQQQAKFDAFLDEFNHERPHEALAMKFPAEVYSASHRPYLGIPEPHSPFHDRTVVVTSCGRLCLYNKKINLSVSLAGQAVGGKEVDDRICLVSFMNYDLGYIDLEEKPLQPLQNPFGLKVGFRHLLRLVDFESFQLVDIECVGSSMRMLVEFGGSWVIHAATILSAVV